MNNSDKSVERRRGTDGVGERPAENAVHSMIETDAGAWRTVRQQQSGPNEEKTAQQSNKESASLWPHSQPAGGRAASLPIGSASAFASAAVLPSRTILAARPPDGRRSTETAITAIENGETVLSTTRKRREAATAWTLPRLIRPQPLRVARVEHRTAMQPFYVQLAAYIFSSRYATASQVLRRFPELLPTERTAQRHLRNMANYGLIAVASTRGTSPNFPFVYLVTRKGIAFLKKHLPGGERFQIPATEERRTRGQSLHSVLHELMITEFALMLNKTASDRGDIEILNQERRYFRRERSLTYFANGGTRRIEPDFGFLAAMQDAVGERHVLPMQFVEMELGSHRNAALREKLTAYDRWAIAASEEYLQALHYQHGEYKPNANFRLLLVACDAYGTVGDSHRLLDLFMQAIELPPKMRDRIWLCTASDLNAHGDDAAPLSAQMWFRAKDARHWIPRYRQVMGTNLSRPNRQASVDRRLFLTDKLLRSRLHALFPVTV